MIDSKQNLWYSFKLYMYFFTSVVFIKIFRLAYGEKYKDEVKSAAFGFSACSWGGSIMTLALFLEEYFHKAMGQSSPKLFYAGFGLCVYLLIYVLFWRGVDKKEKKIDLSWSSIKKRRVAFYYFFIILIVFVFSLSILPNLNNNSV